MRCSIPITVLFLASCVGSPQPDPPNLRGPTPTVNEQLITLSPPGTRSLELQLAGGPGAVSPANATLRIYNLDLADPPVDVAPAPDGSFEVTLLASYGQELRVFSFIGERRSQPVDLRLDPTGVQPADRPLAQCFVNNPEDELVLTPGVSGFIELRNTCDTAVTISEVSMRTATSPFSVTDWPAQLAVGQSARITVTSSPGAVGDEEEILLIEIEAPRADRRPVTLVARSVAEE